MSLTDRQGRALEMRRSGKKLEEIGAEFGITKSSAKKLIARAEIVERQAQWASGLPVRYVNALLANGITTRQALERALRDGSLKGMPNIGPKCFQTIERWLTSP